MTGCTHGMPTPASCIDCMDDGNIQRRPQRPWRADPEWHGDTLADYASGCPICTNAIHIGDRIRRAIAPAGDFAWVHAGCLR